MQTMVAHLPKEPFPDDEQVRSQFEPDLSERNGRLEVLQGEDIKGKR